MIKALRKKFILINMLLVSMVLIIVFSTLCISSYRRLQHDYIRTMEKRINQIETQMQPEFENRKALQAPDFMRYPIFVARMDKNGTTKLIASENIDISKELLEQLTTEVAVGGGANANILREHNLRYLIKHDETGTTIAFIDISGNSAAMRLIILHSVFLCVATLSAFFVISFFLSKWALRPVELAWMQQRQFVADASHELKTPLTVILANTGILKTNRTDTIEQQLGWVENTEAEAKRMRKLVDNLLFLAKTDDAKTAVVYSKLNVSDIILGAALAFESVAFERGIDVDTSLISPDIHVSGDEPQLNQLAGILLDNAVKYSRDGSTVTLSLAIKQEKVVFSVHNIGSHLENDDLEHVFDRFYRADKSRSNEGYGLGLSIAKSIAESHHGKITAESNKENGVTFTVIMPTYNN